VYRFVSQAVIYGLVSYILVLTCLTKKLIKMKDVYVLQTTYCYLGAVSKSAFSITGNQLAFYKE